MIVERPVPQWTSRQWGGRGGVGMLAAGGLGLVGAAGVLTLASWAVTSGEAGVTDVVLAAVLSLGLLAWAVPAVALGRRLLRAPQVDAGDVALTVLDPALLAEPMVIPWAEVDRVEHLIELGPWGLPEGLNCSFTGVTSAARPRFPNLLVRVAEPRRVPEARSGWLGTWPLALLPVPSPYLMARPSRTRPTRGFFLVTPDPEAVIARFATASEDVT